jgi:hypothetical protein
MLDISLPEMVRKPIALVGGAVSGKSSVLKMLGAHPLIGSRIIVVPEVFTDLVVRGVIKPSLEVEQNRHNQEVTALELVKAEREHAIKALAQGRTLVCDRGLPDSAVFLPDGIPEFETLTGHTLDEALHRYGLALQLGQPPEEVFNAMRAGNPARIRSYRSAFEMEQGFTEIYSRHSNYVYVPYSANWDEKANAVIKIVEDYLK